MPRRLTNPHAIITRSMVPTALVALSSLLLVGCAEVNVPGNEPMEGIHVTGTGTVQATPDIARAQIAVQTMEKDAQLAVDENNRRMNAVMAELARLAISDKDMKTVAFNVYPIRDWRVEAQGEIVGFQVTNALSVTIRDLKRVGEVLQAAITAGANDITSLYFTVEKPEPYRQEARAKAVQDARARAESMAKAAGVELGKAVRITEGSSVMPVRDVSEKALGGGSVPVQPGELEITVSVDVVFEIQ